MSATTSNRAPTQEAILEAVEDAGGPLQPKEIVERTGLPTSSVQKTVRTMKENGLLVQPGYGLYDLPSRVEEDVRYNAGDGSPTSDHSSHSSDRLRAVPVWGGQAPSHTDHMMHLDTALLTATGISFDGTTIIPIQGSQAEPYLSHGQLALATPVDRIQGEDLYVYYSWAQQAHLVAWMDRCADTITLQTASRQNTYQPTGTQNIWERDDGRKEKLRVVGRVVGAVLPVGRQRAQKQELVRMLMNQ